MFIMERLVQECPGGVQLSYKCRPLREFPQNYLETELEEYQPDATWKDDDMAEMVLRQKERRCQREAEALAKATREATAAPEPPQAATPNDLETEF